MDSKLKQKAMVSVILILVLILAIGGGSYAWFTANRNANTSRVSGKTSSESVTLYLSATSGSAFVKKDECTIAQVNKTDQEMLLPVSTDDLLCFVNGNGMGGYELIDSETQFYHGRIYMLADAGEGSSEYSSMEIYLANTDSMLKADTDSLLLNAARLGLTFDRKDSVILSLSNTTNEKADQISNTYINGELIADGNVIHSSTNGDIKAVADPAVYYRDMDVTAEKAVPLTTIELGKEYTVDIYFYLEGCDPDCSDSIRKNGGTFNLQFMGILQ